MNRPDQPMPSPAARPGSRPGAASFAAAARAFVVAVLAFAILLVLYRPALHGPFVSDDYPYVSGNPYVQQPSLDDVLAILDPRSEASTSVQNYAPVHLLLHAAAWRAFGDATAGHHVVNLAAHAVVAALLAELFAASGIPLVAALAGALLFLLHPANVEAVAWISQLKTTSSLALALAALLVRPRRPALGLALFALALLAKATALFALPVVAILTWLESAAPAASSDAAQAGRIARRRRWAWAAAWLVVALVYAAAELPANLHTNASAPPIHLDLGVRARSVVAISARYLAMAALGVGTSTFHEPPPARSWTDPWFVAGAVALGLLAWRFASALRRRPVEAAYWMWAVAAYSPVCQILPFLYPMADRYLYTVLPALIGGALLAGGEAVGRMRRPLARRTAVAAASLLACVFALGFGAKSHERAALWGHASGIIDDAIAHYPDGSSARVRHAQTLAQRGDRDGAVRVLRSVKPFALELTAVLADPSLVALRGHPGFQQLLRDLAEQWIAWGARIEPKTQRELRQLAMAHLVRGETAEARAALERGLALPGPRSAELRADLEAVGRVEAALDRTREAGGAGSAGRETADAPPEPAGGGAATTPSR
jgi:hypothetical protein